MAELVVQLRLLGHVGVVDAELGLADEDVAVPVVDEEVAVVGLEAVLDPDDFELLARGSDGGVLHLLEQAHDLLGSVALDLAAQQVVDVEDELLPRLLVGQRVLGDLQQQAEAVDDQLVAGVLDGALEDEVVGDLHARLHEVHEALGLDEVGALLQQVLRPLHQHPPHRAGVELGLAVLDDLGDLGTGEQVLAEHGLHVGLEGVLLLDGPVEEEVDVLVDGLVVQVLGVAEAERGEVLEQVHVGLGGGHIGELDLGLLRCLRVPVLQLLEDVVESII